MIQANKWRPYLSFQKDFVMLQLHLVSLIIINCIACVCVLHYELFSSLVLTSFDFSPQNVFGTFHKYKQPCYASIGALFIKQRFYMFDVDQLLKINCSWRLLLSYGDNIYLWGNLTTASGSLKLSWSPSSQAWSTHKSPNWIDLDKWKNVGGGNK